MKARSVWMVASVLLGLAALGAGLARADGLPVLGAEGGSHGGDSFVGHIRYVTRPAAHDTRVLRLSRSGHVMRALRLPGRFVFPVVAYDGSSAGISADDRTLVLIHPRLTFPQSNTSLAILDARELRVRSYVRLRGDFSFDAVSPDGHWIYVIQYTSRSDPTRYRVRALSAGAGRLLARDIVDPRDRTDPMRGNPITRASSPDGRWAYTLYDGDGHPFVHALDTAGHTARCIDLPAFPASSNPWAARLRLSPDRTQLLVTSNQRTLAAVNTRTLAVSDHLAASYERPGAGHVQRSSLAGVLRIAAIVAILVVLSTAALAIRHRRPRVVPQQGLPPGR